MSGTGHSACYETELPIPNRALQYTKFLIMPTIQFRKKHLYRKPHRHGRNILKHQQILSRFHPQNQQKCIHKIN